MFLGLFKRKAMVVTVKRKAKSKKAVQPKKKKVKAAKPKIRKKPPRATKKKPAVKKKIKTPSAAKVMPRIVGKVTHYFPHVKAGVILVSDGTIAVGDTLRIKGHTTEFKQKIKSMQINNVPITEAKPGQEVGLLLKSRVRHNDVVYKL